MRARTTRILGSVLCVVLVTSIVAAPAAAQGEEQEEFLVALDASGDANVSLTLTYDLQSEDERDAFRELQENSTAQEAVAERFENRMTAVAADASDATGREMSVGSASVELEETEDVGAMTLSIAWASLAAVDGDRLTVTEPFSSGFDPEMAFTVSVPDDYELVSTTPEPSSTTGATATWDGDASLQGFELVTAATVEDGSTSADTDGDGTGVGVVVALGALLVGALFNSRVRSLDD